MRSMRRDCGRSRRSTPATSRGRASGRSTRCECRFRTTPTSRATPTCCPPTPTTSLTAVFAGEVFAQRRRPTPPRRDRAGLRQRRRRRIDHQPAFREPRPHGAILRRGEYSPATHEVVDAQRQPHGHLPPRPHHRRRTAANDVGRLRQRRNDLHAAAQSSSSKPNTTP